MASWLKGQGFAYARYVHSKFPGFGAAWAAWVADVEVHRVTGEVHVRRVVVGHDAGMMVNPAGVRASGARQRAADHQPRAEGARRRVDPSDGVRSRRRSGAAIRS